VHAAAEQAHAITHAAKAAARPLRSCGECGLHIAAVTVVLDPQPGLIVIAIECNVHARSACMLDRVRERFLCDTEHQRRAIIVERILRRVEIELDVERVRLGKRAHEPAHGRLQAEIVEDLWAQQA
jgi:hypothetical protein